MSWLINRLTQSFTTTQLCNVVVFLILSQAMLAWSQHFNCCRVRQLISFGSLYVYFGVELRLMMTWLPLFSDFVVNFNLIGYRVEWTRPAIGSTISTFVCTSYHVGTIHLYVCTRLETSSSPIFSYGLFHDQTYIVVCNVMYACCWLNSIEIVSCYPELMRRQTWPCLIYM